MVSSCTGTLLTYALYLQAGQVWPHLLFLQPDGPQKRLLWSIPKPSSVQASHLLQPAKADFSLALLRRLSPPNLLALSFGGGPRCNCLRPKGLNFGTNCPKVKRVKEATLHRSKVAFCSR